MSEKAKVSENYNSDQVAAIEAACEIEPLNLERAKELGVELGKSYRSIIAKCLSLELAYESKQPEPKRIVKATKAEVVADIQKRLASDSLSGLEKATMSALVTLRDSVACSLAFAEPAE